MPRITSANQRQLVPLPQQDQVSNLATARFTAPWLSIASSTTGVTCIHWRSDGLRLWVGATNNKIIEYSVSTAFDLTSTVTNLGELTTINQVQAIYLRPDGQVMFWLDGGTMHSYTLLAVGTITSDWVPLATRNLTTVIGGAPSEDLLRGFDFSPDGTRLTLAADLTNRLINLSLSTGFNIASTMAVAQTLNFTADGSPYDFHWGPSGLSYYVLGDVNDRIYQYGSVVTAYNLPASLSAQGNIILNPTLGDTAVRGMDFSANGKKVYVITDTLDRVHQLTLNSAWTLLGGYSYTPSLNDQSNFSPSTLGSEFVTAVFFKPDGLRMWILNYSTNRIYQLILFTAWSLDSALIDTNVALSAGPGQARGLFVHPDGTSFYVVGTTEDRIYQYSMPTPWSIVGATNLAFSPSFSTEETEANGVFFRADGRMAFVTGVGSDQIRRYDLATPWDITTMSFTQSTSITVTNPSDLTFQDTGRRFWVVFNGRNLRQYNLTTPWDLTTASLAGSFDLSRYDNLYQGIFLRADGRRLYLLSQFCRMIALTLGAPTAEINLTDNISGATDEGITFSMDLATQNISDGTEFLWSIDEDHLEDFDPSSGSVTISENAASWQIEARPDFLIEGEETWSLSVTRPSGTVVADTGSLFLSDTYAATFTLTSPAGSSGNQWPSNSSLEFEFTATSGSVPNGYTFYWTVSAPSLFSASSGSFTYNSGFGLGTFTVIPQGQTGAFTASVRQGSTSGPVLATSATITLI